jgi:hypothetical protein
MKTALTAAVIGVVVILTGTLLMDTHPTYEHTAITLITIGGITATAAMIGLIIHFAEDRQ